MIRACLLFLLLADASAFAAEARSPRQLRARQPAQNRNSLNVPAHPFDLVLGRPTSHSVTVSVLCYQETEGSIAFGVEEGQLELKTGLRSFKQGEPVEVVLTSLRPDTRYRYQFRSTLTNSAVFSFRTARPAGSGFTFTVTADSHLDDRTDPEINQRTMASARDDGPDFHIDLGDTFMTEKHSSREDAVRQYLAQRFYLGQLAQSVPLFLVLGNHDGESPRGRGSEAESLAIWSHGTRTRYFPNPVPDDFYTGNARKHPAAGWLQDYYAWEWGNALFVVLDPFWFTQQERRQRDGWVRTLGEEQVRWLQHTLEGSRARFKLVFIHHLVGGLDDQCRGGSEAARFYEWGGRNADGTDGFKEHRPAWTAPIHQLLLQSHVNIVFHGHDHFYARQELDGIVYQEVPQPGNESAMRTPRHAEEYGYRSGTILGGSGYLRVTVCSNELAVAYQCSSQGAYRMAHCYTVQYLLQQPSRP